MPEMPPIPDPQSDPTSSYAQPTLFPLIPSLPKGHLRRLRLCALPKGRLRPPRRTPAASSAVKAFGRHGDLFAWGLSSASPMVRQASVLNALSTDSRSGWHSQAPPDEPDFRRQPKVPEARLRLCPTARTERVWTSKAFGRCGDLSTSAAADSGSMQMFAALHLWLLPRSPWRGAAFCWLNTLSRSQTPSDQG